MDQQQAPSPFERFAKSSKFVVLNELLPFLDLEEAVNIARLNRAIYLYLNYGYRRGLNGSLEPNKFRAGCACSKSEDALRQNQVLASIEREISNFRSKLWQDPSFGGNSKTVEVVHRFLGFSIINSLSELFSATVVDEMKVYQFVRENQLTREEAHQVMKQAKKKTLLVIVRLNRELESFEYFGVLREDLKFLGEDKEALNLEDLNHFKVFRQPDPFKWLCLLAEAGGEWQAKPTNSLYFSSALQIVGYLQIPKVPVFVPSNSEYTLGFDLYFYHFSKYSSPTLKADISISVSPVYFEDSPAGPAVKEGKAPLLIEAIKSEGDWKEVHKVHSKDFLSTAIRDQLSKNKGKLVRSKITTFSIEEAFGRMFILKHIAVHLNFSSQTWGRKSEDWGLVAASVVPTLIPRVLKNPKLSF